LSTTVFYTVKSFDHRGASHFVAVKPLTGSHPREPGSALTLPDDLLMSALLLRKVDCVRLAVDDLAAAIAF
jgi:hypothetical protein